MIKIYSILVRLGRWADQQRYRRLLEYIRAHMTEPPSSIARRFGVSRQEATAIRGIFRRAEIKPQYAPWQEPPEVKNADSK